MGLLLLFLVAVGCLMLGGAGGMFVLLFLQRARERDDSRRIVESVWESYPDPLPCAHYVEPVDAEFEELTPRSTLAELDDLQELRSRPTEPGCALPELTPDDEPTARYSTPQPGDAVLTPGVGFPHIPKINKLNVNGALHPEGAYASGPVPWAPGVYVWKGAVPPPDALKPDGPLDVGGTVETPQEGPPAVQSGRYGVAS